MAFPGLIENLRGLIVSHSNSDEVMFRKSVEAIVRELSIGNHPGEARVLRDAIRAMESSGRGNGTMTILNKQTQGLVSFVPDAPRPRLFLSKDTKASLDRIISEYHSSKQLAEAGFCPRARLLFWGPPGCGKTAAAKTLATDLALPLGVVKLGALITSYVGETGGNLQKVLAMADQTPMVLLLDEADAIAKARDDSNDVGESRRFVNALLQALESWAPRRSLTILASNHSHLFDPALWRRFDDIIKFPLPAQPERLAQLKYLSSGLKIRGSLVRTAEQLSGFSFAEIERAVTEVAKTKILEKTGIVTTEQFVTEGKRWRKKMLEAGRASNKR